MNLITDSHHVTIMTGHGTPSPHLRPQQGLQCPTLRGMRWIREMIGFIGFSQVADLHTLVRVLTRVCVSVLCLCIEVEAADDKSVNSNWFTGAGDN